MAVHFRENKDKISVTAIVTGIVVVGILVTSLIIYLLDSNSSDTEEGIIEQSQAENTSKENTQLESASTEIGKSVNEVANELNEAQAENIIANETRTNNKTKTNTSTNKKSTNTTVETTSANIVPNNEVESSTIPEKEEEVNFTVPVKGEILREFSPDSLVYSDTLEEWITHKGIDIKADKTSVVTAAADGTVSAIKNDPRYGLTVIVDHKGGYQTVYANLLTAEYVVQGEEIKAGQTIGTVGNTATFEISDDFHLHFELLKDGEYENPTNYINL